MYRNKKDRRGHKRQLNREFHWPKKLPYGTKLPNSRSFCWLDDFETESSKMHHWHTRFYAKKARRFGKQEIQEQLTEWEDS